jgi:hypothetical protein
MSAGTAVRLATLLALGGAGAIGYQKYVPPEQAQLVYDQTRNAADTTYAAVTRLLQTMQTQFQDAPGLNRAQGLTLPTASNPFQVGQPAPPASPLSALLHPSQPLIVDPPFEFHHAWHATFQSQVEAPSPAIRRTIQVPAKGDRQ